MTTARKLDEATASMTPEEKEDARKFLVFLAILAIAGAIVAILRRRS